MSESENPSTRIEAAIDSSELVSLTKEYSEIAIDGMLDEGTLRDLPLVGSVVGVVSFGNSVSKMLFAKKVYKFLFQLNGTQEYQRRIEIQDINRTKKHRSHVGTTLIELLEKIDSDFKPEILGKMFVSVLKGQTEYVDFLRAAHVLNNTFYYDLLELKNHCDGNIVKDLEIKDTIFHSGLTSTDFAGGYREYMDDPNAKEINSTTSLSKLGQLIVKIGMG
jgi:hypothetical protein